MTFRQTVEALAEHFRLAVAQKDGAACASIYSDNAIKVNPGGQVVEGRDAIGFSFQELFDTGEFIVTGIDVRDCRCDGGIGFAMLRMNTIEQPFYVMLGLERNGRGDWSIAQEVIGG
ncbi:YybH family protein [Aestuariivirga sp.]|uniref:YybH family protein n=1 Tax=Aestuariivirga sp. TaxID=2650926 RepID=UPI00391DD28E